MGEYTAELPLSEDGITFTYWMTSQPFMMTYGGSLDYNTLPFYEAMEALTGVHLDLTVHSMQSSQEQFNLMFATGDYPDMFEGEYTSGAGQGIEDDVIVPLNDYLSEYMPNYSASEAFYPMKKTAVMYCCKRPLLVIASAGRSLRTLVNYPCT